MRYIASIIVSVLLMGCTGPVRQSIKPVVSVSIAPQKYFVERLMGDSVEVNVMIPPGSGHATYAPTPGQLKNLSQSVAYFKMGHLGFEASWSEKFEAANRQMLWFDLSQGIDVIQGEHHHHHSDEDQGCTGGIDPHIWTSPTEMKVVIANLKKALLNLFPDNNDLINSNYEAFMNDIQGLDEQLYQLKETHPGLNFMIFHPAYTYLARTYGFEQMTIEFEGKTPTPARLKQTIELAREKGVRIIYIQEEFDRKKADVIAAEIGAQTVQVNPLSENWLDEMNRFISHLQTNN
ncbi:MAG: zinc ABC transporter substrate-binding protein [Marinilabiliaceae bacterium]|nr:zinc ABC transporter substrate-binding protein [Marinilabiliaceae bacterium]